AHIDASNRAELDDLIYGRGGSWNTKGNIESSKLVQQWAQCGYFFPGFEGISGDDAVQIFHPPSDLEQARNPTGDYPS
ncbi:hypothetical protein ACC687_42660, partial [Rhizobium ruizarguesonis]